MDPRSPISTSLRRIRIPSSRRYFRRRGVLQGGARDRTRLRRRRRSDRPRIDTGAPGLPTEDFDSGLTRRWPFREGFPAAPGPATKPGLAALTDPEEMMEMAAADQRRMQAPQDRRHGQGLQADQHQFQPAHQAAHALGTDRSPGRSGDPGQLAAAAQGNPRVRGLQERAPRIRIQAGDGVPQPLESGARPLRGPARDPLGRGRCRFRLPGCGEDPLPFPGKKRKPGTRHLSSR